MFYLDQSNAISKLFQTKLCYNYVSIIIPHQFNVSFTGDFFFKYLNGQ